MYKLVKIFANENEVDFYNNIEDARYHFSKSCHEDDVLCIVLVDVSNEEVLDTAN